jgi:hypothetical protein
MNRITGIKNYLKKAIRIRLDKKQSNPNVIVTPSDEVIELMTGQREIPKNCVYSLDVNQSTRSHSALQVASTQSLEIETPFASRTIIEEKTEDQKNKITLELNKEQKSKEEKTESTDQKNKMTLDLNKKQESKEEKTEENNWKKKIIKWLTATGLVGLWVIQERMSILNTCNNIKKNIQKIQKETDILYELKLIDKKTYEIYLNSLRNYEIRTNQVSNMLNLRYKGHFLAEILYQNNYLKKNNLYNELGDIQEALVEWKSFLYLQKKNAVLSQTQIEFDNNFKKNFEKVSNNRRQHDQKVEKIIEIHFSNAFSRETGNSDNLEIIKSKKKKFKNLQELPMRSDSLDIGIN